MSDNGYPTPNVAQATLLVGVTRDTTVPVFTENARYATTVPENVAVASSLLTVRATRSNLVVSISRCYCSLIYSSASFQIERGRRLCLCVIMFEYVCVILFFCVVFTFDSISFLFLYWFSCFDCWKSSLYVRNERSNKPNDAISQSTNMLLTLVPVREQNPTSCSSFCCSLSRAAFTTRWSATTLLLASSASTTALVRCASCRTCVLTTFALDPTR